MHIRMVTCEDVAGILQLYCDVARVPGGLARLENEVSESVVEAFVDKAIRDGIGLVAEARNGEIVGEIHAYRSGLFCFSHVLSELTIAVHSRMRRQGIGRQLFGKFFERLEANHTEITRVELISRESNRFAIAFYQSLGFQMEGRLERRIRNVDGSFEADIPMGWTR